MSRFLITFGLAMSLVTISLSAAEAGQSGKKETRKKTNPQTTCPVMGGKIDPALYADVKGHRVYVCCKGCLPKVKKNPDTYIEKLEKQGVDVEKIQTTCPVMGGKINRDLYVDAQGKRIYLCCKGCVSAVKDDPETYIEKLEKQGITVETLDKTEKDKHTH